MAIDFKEFKKVKLDTFNGEVIDPSKRDDYCLNETNPNIDDKIWGVREDSGKYRVSQMWLGGKKYGEVNPKEEHKLPYYYLEDNTKHQFKFTPDFLMKEGIYVVDNQSDFDKCAGKKIESPDILNEWVQYTDRCFMPEYGNGYSETLGQHIGNIEPDTQNGYDLGIGYGHWTADSDLNIYNSVNSFDYNGYINPQKTSKFNYTTVIGTDKGGTTGDWAGYALIDDSNAHPRRIECSDGKTYYRNTLYDLPYSERKNETLNNITRTDLWCAWVNEDEGKGFAYIIYGAQVSGTDEFSGGYVDDFPNGDVKIYKANKIKTREDRLTLDSDVNLTTHVNKTYDSYGYVVTLNILTQNTSNINLLNYNLTKNENPYLFIGTVIIFTNVIPCGSETIRNDISKHLGVTQDPSKDDAQYYVPNSDYQCYIVYPYTEPFDNPDTPQVDYVLTTDNIRHYGYDKLYGVDLVDYVVLPYDANVSLDCNENNLYSFIRSNILFDNGVLTLQFSDVVGQRGTTLASNPTFLDNDKIDVNLPLNGSSLVIDFNNKTATLTPYSGHSNVDNILKNYANQNIPISTQINDLSSLEYATHTYDIKDENGNINPVTINVFDSFKSDVKFMYIAQSMANLCYKCYGYSYEDRLILDVNRNEVYKYNNVINEYEKVINNLPVDYFTGSHISFNEITNKLWYSNGYNIQYVGNITDLIAGNNIHIDDNGEISVTGLTNSMSLEYNDLVDLKNNSKLIPGSVYRLTNYECTSIDINTETTKHQFDILITADDESTLNENVRFTHHEGDTYFSGSTLESWEGKYSIDNDTNRFGWADSTNGKGVIYWLKDEWNNECPYDFKNIQFKRVVNNSSVSGYTIFYTFNGDNNIDDSLNGNSYNNSIQNYYNNKILTLNNNIFGKKCYSNILGYNCYNNIFGDYNNTNKFGNSCHHIEINNNFIKNCEFKDNVKYCLISDCLTDETHYLQNITILKGTQGKYTNNVWEYLNLCEMEVYDDNGNLILINPLDDNITNDYEEVPSLICGIVRNQQKEIIYQVKNIFDTALL